MVDWSEWPEHLVLPVLNLPVNDRCEDRPAVETPRSEGPDMAYLGASLRCRKNLLSQRVVKACSRPISLKNTLILSLIDVEV
jgi:hypothetical protein